MDGAQMAKISPTQRSLKLLRERGWTCQVVERWNQWAKVRQDLFGCLDILAISPRDREADAALEAWCVKNLAGKLMGAAIIGVQVTSGSGHSDRRKKIL